MPLIDVTYEPTIDQATLHRLAAALPEIVSRAVECPEEPRTGPLSPGDADVRFHPRSPLDVGGLEVSIEVRTKLFSSRVVAKQRRVDLILDEVAQHGLGLGQVGVWLILDEGAYNQTTA